MKSIYLVVFQLPEWISEKELFDLSDEKNILQHVIQSGSLISYSISMDLKKIWAVFVVNSESELQGYIDTFPGSEFLEYQYTLLSTHNSIYHMPSVSYN